VTLSVTTLDRDLSLLLEPRASLPANRLKAIKALAEEGVPVCVNVAPVIPGLTDHEVPAILEAAAQAGAGYAKYIILRLPHALKTLFQDWLEEHYPKRMGKILGAIREMRGGELTDNRFGSRMTGEGPRAEAIETLFRINCKRHGLNTQPFSFSTHHFKKSANIQESFL